MKMKTNNNSNKRLVPLALTLMVALVTLTLCLISSAGAPLPSLFKTNANTQYPSLTDHIAPLDDRGITWDEQINSIETTNGTADYVVFGEAPDAHGGIPPDSYDVAKPPVPIEPYTRVWLNDNLPVPYNKLWKDYRYWSSLNVKKTWNLTVQWVPINGEKYPTTSLTLSWGTDGLVTSEYDKIVLLTSTYVVLVPDMVTTTSYQYTAAAEVSRYFRINCTVDTKPPQIINHSPGTGETGDPFTFNAEVFDDMTPTSSLIVKVNWVHGSLSGNDTMTSAGGNYFVKTITLDESTEPLTYHFYAKDNAKVPNTNYTPAITATISDDEPPVITFDSGDENVGTGNDDILWVQATDNLPITGATATVTIDSNLYAMSWSAGNSRWEYVYTAPTGSVASHSYTVTVYDAAANSDASGPYMITVFDDDAPVITGDSGAVGVTTGESVTLWCTATDNIGVANAKISVDGGAQVLMTWSVSQWEYVFIAPGGSVASHSYSVWVYDAVPLSHSHGPYTITVTDNDAPIITGILATPTHQLINGYVNITATVTDNINVNVVKVNISGPTGFTNVSMIKDGGDKYFYNISYTLVGTYNYYIWAKDTSNNGIKSTLYQFDIFAELQITTLKTGWNFVSLPFNLTVPKTNLFIKSGITRYTWGQAVANHIIINATYNWTENQPQQHYNLTNALKPGTGYWLYAYSECQLWATNLTPITSTDFITSMINKWNIVGVPIGTSVSKANLIVRYLGVDYTWAQAVTNGYVVKDIFGWSRTVPQGYFIADVLDPGYCYWIYAYYDCTLKRT